MAEPRGLSIPREYMDQLEHDFENATKEEPKQAAKAGLLKKIYNAGKAVACSRLVQIVAAGAIGVGFGAVYSSEVKSTYSNVAANVSSTYNNASDYVKQKLGIEQKVEAKQ